VARRVKGSIWTVFHFAQGRSLFDLGLSLPSALFGMGVVKIEPPW
jgi:hypothetical protein